MDERTPGHVSVCAVRVGVVGRLCKSDTAQHGMAGHLVVVCTTDGNGCY